MLPTLSCASTQLTDNWKDSAYTGPAYKKIMVVALMKRDDLRKPVEDEFRGQLKAKGVDAKACYECIPDVDESLVSFHWANGMLRRDHFCSRPQPLDF